MTWRETFREGRDAVVVIIVMVSALPFVGTFWLFDKIGWLPGQGEKP